MATAFTTPPTPSPRVTGPVQNLGIYHLETRNLFHMVTSKCLLSTFDQPILNLNGFDPTLDFGLYVNLKTFLSRSILMEERFAIIP